jgi:hypothetical protein
MSDSPGDTAFFGCHGALCSSNRCLNLPVRTAVGDTTHKHDTRSYAAAAAADDDDDAGDNHTYPHRSIINVMKEVQSVVEEDK